MRRPSGAAPALSLRAPFLVTPILVTLLSGGFALEALDVW
jgi:hypothetical protein